MSGKVFISDDILQRTAKSIQDVLGVETQYAPQDFPDAIKTIPESWYGVEVDTTVSNPAIRRIGAPVLHRNLPIQSGMKRCLLADDGTVNYYLDDNDSTLKADGVTASVLDGTDGQVMVEIPAHYRKIEIEGTKQRVKFSQYPLEGYTYVPDMYVSAFEAALDRTNSKLASVVNTTAQYRGGDNTSGFDGTYRSLLGKPATSIILTSFRTYARNRGTGWACQDLHVYTEMWLLYLVEYANRNCQLAYNPNLDANGYRQGGLGDGVTTTTSDNWSSYNSSNPFIPCGATLSLGNNTGVVSYAVPSATKGEVWATFNVPSYRGVENPFGHVWKWTDGILVNIAASGTSDVYVCDNPTKYASSLTADYNKVGEEARKSNYTQNVIFPYPIANQVSGSSMTGYCDYHYTSIQSSGSSLRGVYWGGNANNSANAGFAYANSNNEPSNTNANIGSQLSFLKKIKIQFASSSLAPWQKMTFSIRLLVGLSDCWRRADALHHENGG